MSGSAVDATVVIPSYNAGPLLIACLRALDHQIGGGAFEVVVIDDGSTDGTGERVRQLRTGYPLHYRYLPRTRRSSRSAARNAGLSLARGEVVVMLDADQVSIPTLLAAHLERHASDRRAVVLGPRRFLPEGPADIEALSRGQVGQLAAAGRPDKRDRLLDELGAADIDELETCWHHMYTCNASVRREHLRAVGGFDENFLGWGLEDSELGYRLRRHDLVFTYHRGAEVFHEYRPPREQNVEWRHNLTYFETKHNHVDVMLQRLMDSAAHPPDNRPTWLDSAIRFEYAARAVHGRVRAGS